MSGQLKELAVLRAALDTLLAGPAAAPSAQQWYQRITDFAAEMRGLQPQDLRNRKLLERLWDNNPIAAVGNGTVRMAPALDDKAFVDWFSGLADAELPSEAAAREARLVEVYNGLLSRLQKLCTRTPRLKANRVLCALYPQDFTSIANVGALLSLHRQMGGSSKEHPVRAHIAIRRRIDEALGVSDGQDPLELARRMCLPWMLYEHGAGDTPGEIAIPSPDGQAPLVPQPAALRRKGLTAMRGGFQTLLGLLTSLDEGLTREEFLAAVAQAVPDLAPSSQATFINVVAREFALCVRENDLYRLSARGLNLLDTRDPYELADLLLTRVLGIDHVVKALATQPQSKGELIALLRRVNPGWTTNYAPSAVLQWLVSLRVIEPTQDQRIILTEAGRRWSELVTWEPEFLQPLPAMTDALATQDKDLLQLPSWAELTKRIQGLAGGKLCFDDALVRQLHAGLWFHPVRHFAVLSGLSGSGKTQLALHYARALCGGDVDAVKVIPVQPGWFDPSPLLGYMHPLHQDTYRSTPFLELLLSAADNPGQPHVAILDEMNLSHPEQYLAPVLSAMETCGVIDLHQAADDLCGIPPGLDYPANLALIGTVNMDETTHGLSDKVLDRAFTLEFWNITVADFPLWNTANLQPEMRDKARQVLQALGEILAPVRLHFGWRTIDDVVRYLSLACELGMAESALDDALYAKVLPKLRGEVSQRFEAALQAAHQLMHSQGLQRCRDKLAAMRADLAESGTTRFWR